VLGELDGEEGGVGVGVRAPGGGLGQDHMVDDGMGGFLPGDVEGLVGEDGGGHHMGGGEDLAWGHEEAGADVAAIRGDAHAAAGEEVVEVFGLHGLLGLMGSWDSPEVFR
jgi:hypothetical protein